MTGYVNFASSSEDEFPDLDVVLQRSKQVRRACKASTQETTSKDDEPSPSRQLEEEAIRWNSPERKEPRRNKSGNTTAPLIVRRRKLGAKADNPLLKPFGAFGRNEGHDLLEFPVKTKKPPVVGIRELRARGKDPSPSDFSSHGTDDESQDGVGAATEITEADISEFFGGSPSEFEEDEPPTLSGRGKPASNLPRPLPRRSQEKVPTLEYQQPRRLAPGIELPNPKSSKIGKTQQGTAKREPSVERTLGQNAPHPKSTIIDLTDDMTDALRQLDM